jgi:hypothetical protein
MNNSHVPILSLRVRGKCQFPNYIPHPTPANSTYSKWVTHYEQDLENIYRLFKTKLTEQFPGQRFDDAQTYDAVIRMIYRSSSKHLS